MNSDKPGKGKDIDADQQQRAVDKLEEMWDRELAKGDDEFFESTDRHRAAESKDNDQHEEQQHPRRRARRI